MLSIPAAGLDLVPCFFKGGASQLRDGGKLSNQQAVDGPFLRTRKKILFPWLCDRCFLLCIVSDEPVFHIPSCTSEESFRNR